MEIIDSILLTVFYGMFYDFLYQDLSLYNTDVIKVKYVCS